MVPSGATNNKFVKMSPDCLTYGATMSLIWKNGKILQTKQFILYQQKQKQKTIL